MNSTSPTSPPRRGRLAAIAVLVALLAASCAGASTDASTSAAAASDTVVSIAAESDDFLGDYTLIDEDFGTEVTVSVTDGVRTIVSNSLPNHETGDFPNAGNPNTISEQALTFTFTTDPAYTGEAAFAQTPGVALNGVTMEPGTAETATCASGQTYRVEALQDFLDLGLDENNAHVQPNGQYHYHGLSDLLVDAFEAGDDLVLVGFAADGHLIYASLSGTYETSYTVSTQARVGTDCVHSGRDAVTVDLEGTTPDGTYTSDWVYEDGSGDLDECNGTLIDGVYAYVITDEYPYIPRCLMGEFDAGPPPPA